MSEEKKISLPFFGIPKLFPWLEKYRGTIALMIFLGFVSSMIDSVYPLFNRWALDHFVAEGTLAGLPAFIGLYLLVLASQILINYKSMLDSGRVEMSVDRDLRNAAFDHLQTLSFSYFNRNSVGYIHARVISDTGKIGEAVSWRMMDLVWNGAYILSALIVMLMLDLRLAVWVILLLAAAAALIVFFQGRLVGLNRRIRETNAKITGDFNEGISGARTIRILGVENRMQGDFERDTEQIKRESVHAVHYSALFSSTVTFMSAAALSVVLWQGGLLSREGILRIGTLSVFVTYALEMIEPLQTMIRNYAAFVAIQVNIERLMRLLAEESDVGDTPEVIERYGDTFHPKTENWEELHGDIEFRDVSFRYPDGKEYVMEHVSLKIPHGTNIALVGETGAGKSTLVNLVCRFYEPTGGQLLIDGRDARERSQLWLHSHIGYVLQTPHLFSGTVRDNLLYGNPGASDAEIVRALRLVSADGIVARLAGEDAAGETVTDAEVIRGLDFGVGEGGSMLSTGEKQLLSFARALIADPRLLILDEATASIDTITESAVQKAISVVTKGRTSFVIAHRLSTVVNADLILVVRGGKIVERGTHRELMEKNGYYASMYRMQAEVSA
ncbi:MAG: ABC transporter ATP-binding protein [Lachnospiraceae bacterium]|nr:ABC transporter ATP-binding protein [Lachnospiraceae bacterium]